MSDVNLIANRYEVFQHIGQGGMADVFLAVDTILNRQVAIKILRSELTTDAVSVLRFEREAQAATALSHPNIVEIYDVGEYKGHHYIVMEYVPGKTLKKMIQQRGGLETSEAVDIMKQLCSAVAEAHRKGIIHRDLKPQNVIVKADGSVKILDFGIALAKGAVQLTQANNVMGSVHYLAPELARGAAASPQSDIYALGICFFEMLTGDVPFKADSAVQVALMHMRNPMPSVRAINPAVPQSVENIIIRATAKDPSLRYDSCTSMLEDLETCMLDSRKNEPKLILPSSKVQSASSDAHRENGKKEEPAEKNQDGLRVVKPAVERKTKTGRGLLALLIVLLCILGTAGIYFGLRVSGVLDPESREVPVPDLIGMSLSDAKNASTDAGVILDTENVTYTLTSDTEKGKIISTDPAVGTEVERNSRISVTVSSGIGVVCRNYTGMGLQQAVRDLSQYQYLKVDTVEEQSTTASPGTIIRQELLEPGTMFNPDTEQEIRLVYAAYPTITIPDDLVGKPIDEATAELSALGVKALTSNLDTSNFTEEELAQVQTGVVISCDPEAGSSYTQREDNYVVLYYY